MALALSCSIAVARSEQAGAWITDAGTGCRVWNPHPQAGESIKWSGPCANGLAHGRGVAQWYRGDVAYEKDEGEWRDGRQVGKGVQVWPSGRYDGEMADGDPHGHGVLTLQGVLYDGEFRNGKPNGIGTMTNASGVFQGTWKDGCFRDQKRKASLGVPLSDCP
jgi:hypothetical protein